MHITKIALALGLMMLISGLETMFAPDIAYMNEVRSYVLNNGLTRFTWGFINVCTALMWIMPTHKIIQARCYLAGCVFVLWGLMNLVPAFDGRPWNIVGVSGWWVLAVLAFIDHHSVVYKPQYKSYGIYPY